MRPGSVENMSYEGLLHVDIRMSFVLYESDPEERKKSRSRFADQWDKFRKTGTKSVVKDIVIRLHWLIC